MHFFYLPLKKASISKCSSLRPERLGFKMSLPMLSFSKYLFKTKTNKRGKAALLTTTLSAERTLHAIGKNYAIKTIPAGKRLERNLLDH